MGMKTPNASTNYELITNALLLDLWLSYVIETLYSRFHNMLKRSVFGSRQEARNWQNIDRKVISVVQPPLIQGLTWNNCLSIIKIWQYTVLLYDMKNSELNSIWSVMQGSVNISPGMGQVKVILTNVTILV
jgi:hypothetical protein